MFYLLDAAQATNGSISIVWQYVIIGFVGAASTYAIQKIEEAREKRREKRKSQDKDSNLEAVLKHNNTVQRNIKEVLIQIQGYTQCSRASLLSYHNGTKTHYGYSMNYISMIEEKTDGIVVPIIDVFQRVPAAAFRAILDKIDDSDEGYAIVKKEDLDEEDRAVMDKYQNSVCYHFKVGNSVWEGVVELAWVNKYIILSDTEIDHVRELVGNIYELQKQLIKPEKGEF